MTVADPSAARAPIVGNPSQPATAVRETVRDLLLSTAAFHALPQEQRYEIAKSLVQVCQTAVSLIGEEAHTEQLASRVIAQPLARMPLAMAANAGSQFSGVSAEKVAGTTRAILNAVSFPRFVTELINGVFKALVDSNQQQMQSFVELIRNVAATTEGFADMNLAPDRARQWLLDAFPGSFELDSGGDNDPDLTASDAEPSEARIRLRSGASMPSEAALRTGLGLEASESIPGGDPEATLVPYARRALARQRQQMLATMVMLGMQRIIVESGRLNASMRFHIDTRSAANSDEGSRFDFQNESEASGKFGAGPWGISAKMTNTIGYVSTQKNQTSEEMNTDLDLNSSVELYFKTDYLPLDRLAGKGQVDRIKVNTLNPDAEEQASLKAREARTADARKADMQRDAALDSDLKQSRPAQPRPESSATKSDSAAKGEAPAAAGKKGVNPKSKPVAAPNDKRTEKSPASPPLPTSKPPAKNKAANG